jgi:glutamate racemase
MATNRKSKTNWPEAPIGVFDSGLGGLTVARAIHQLLPHEDLVYLGDTARVPYGTKSPATVTRFACEDTEFLVTQQVKAVVVACNSATAWGLSTLERHFKLPVMGVILPGARAALAATHNQRIGVIGTSATIRSQAYHTSILARCDTARIFARPTPLLVPLVEEGWTNHAVTLAVLREYLKPLLKQRIDTLVLGCTHYPLLKRALRQVVGDGVALVDSAESCAEFVRERLGFLKLLAPGRRRKGVIRPFVTDEPERFWDSAERFLGCATEEPVKVELPACRWFK